MIRRRGRGGRGQTQGEFWQGSSTENGLAVSGARSQRLLATTQRFIEHSVAGRSWESWDESGKWCPSPNFAISKKRVKACRNLTSLGSLVPMSLQIAEPPETDGL